MAELLDSGNVKELFEIIDNETQKNSDFLLGILCWVLNCEHASNSYRLSVWLLENQATFPKERNFLDSGLRISVYFWRTDAIRTFLKLGANPNQEVLPKRNILDVCLNRVDHFYSCEKEELEEAIEALRENEAKTYAEEKYQSAIAANKLFDFVVTYDPWVELAITDISELTVSQQEVIVDLFQHCSNKSSKPSKAWYSKADTILEKLRKSDVLQMLPKWVRASTEIRGTLVYGDLDNGPYYKKSDSAKDSFDKWKMTEKSRNLIKSFLWLLNHLNRELGVSCSYEVAKAMYTKYPLLGIRDTKLANASFEVMLSSEKGRVFAERLIAEFDNPPSIKKMKALLKKC